MTDGDTVEEATANAREAIHLYFSGETAESLAASGVRLDAQIATGDVELDVAITEPALAIAD